MKLDMRIGEYAKDPNEWLHANASKYLRFTIHTVPTRCTRYTIQYTQHIRCTVYTLHLLYNCTLCNDNAHIHATPVIHTYMLRLRFTPRSILVNLQFTHSLFHRCRIALSLSVVLDISTFYHIRRYLISSRTSNCTCTWFVLWFYFVHYQHLRWFKIKYLTYTWFNTRFLTVNFLLLFSEFQVNVVYSEIYTWSTSLCSSLEQNLTVW